VNSGTAQSEVTVGSVEEVECWNLQIGQLSRVASSPWT
jgi:hypothetical protein